MLKFASALATLALLPVTALAQSPPPTSEVTATIVVPTATPTPPVTATHAVAETPTATPEVILTPTLGDLMRVSARLPVPPGTEVRFEILTTEIVVCATEQTTEIEEEGFSRVIALLPPACGQGTQFRIDPCPREEPCVKLVVREQGFSFFGFVPGADLDLGTLRALTGPPVAPPETGMGPAQLARPDPLDWSIRSLALTGAALMLIGGWRRLSWGGRR